jgi:hypothetical protein
MNPANDVSWRGVASALVRSYVADLRAWAAKLVAGYGVAVAMLVGGVLTLFAAIAVGVTALFHLVESHYGGDTAYGAIGGGLLFLAIVLVLVGWAMLRRRTPPLPRPQRQVEAARRILLRPTALRATGWLAGAETVEAEPTTKLFIAAAATILVGWIVSSRLRSSSQRYHERQ